MERFWARMHIEALGRRRWRTRVKLPTEIFDWIEVFYNRTSRHSSIGMHFPMNFENLHREFITAS